MYGLSRSKNIGRKRVYNDWQCFWTHTKKEIEVRHVVLGVRAKYNM